METIQETRCKDCGKPAMPDEAYCLECCYCDTCGSTLYEGEVGICHDCEDDMVEDCGFCIACGETREQDGPYCDACTKKANDQIEADACAATPEERT